MVGFTVTVGLEVDLEQLSFDRWLELSLVSLLDASPPSAETSTSLSPPSPPRPMPPVPP